MPDIPFVHSFLGATHTAELPVVYGILDGLPASLLQTSFRSASRLYLGGTVWQQ